MRMRQFVLSFSSVVLLAFTGLSNAASAIQESAAPETNQDASADAAHACVARTFRNADYVVCQFDPTQNQIRLFLNNQDGKPFGHFNWVKARLADKGEDLLFAMNAGMYHEDRLPVGLYIEDGKTLAPLNNNNGPGNFHLKPNGIFYVAPDGRAYVEETETYLRIKQPPPRYATQSGPMLVIGGAFHPRFLPDSNSVKRRNGVGVNDAGDVFFVLADTPVRFYDFAAFFRDELKTPNALYLDGTISRLYAPGLDRNDPGAAMGPIVGVVIAK